MSVVIADSSGLIAEIDRGSELHEATRSLLDELGADSAARLLVSPFVLAEVDYLVSSRLRRPDVTLAILHDIAHGAYHLELFGTEDLDRTADVMERCANLDVRLTDAANVVLAERHGALDLLTFDERHFRKLRGAGDRPFRLLSTDR